jgi:hypothetical protein
MLAEVLSDIENDDDDDCESESEHEHEHEGFFWMSDQFEK